MFQFRRFPTYCYFIHSTLTRYCRAGFPHSDIHGSKDICSSPWLFAACHVLLRLLMPRHSPCALSSLTFVGAICALFASAGRLGLPSKAHTAPFAPPLKTETRFSFVLKSWRYVSRSLLWSHSCFSELCRRHRSFRLLLCYPKSSTFFSLPRLRAAPSVALLASSVQFSRCSRRVSRGRCSVRRPLRPLSVPSKLNNVSLRTCVREKV